MASLKQQSFMIDNLLRMNDVGHKKKGQESAVSFSSQNSFPCLSSDTNVSNLSSSRSFQSQVEDKPMKPLPSHPQSNSIFTDNKFPEKIVSLNHVWSTSNDLVTKPLSSSSCSFTFSFPTSSSPSSFLMMDPKMDPKIQTLFWQHLLLRRKMSLSKKPRKGGQIRFSQEQTIDLEKIFQENKYISPRDRKRIANKINLTESQVKTWFQNRRAKSKKMDFNSCPSSASSGILLKKSKGSIC